MARATLEERVTALERQVGALLANHGATGRAKDWRRTRGAFTGDDLMKQVFEEGRKIRGSLTVSRLTQPRRVWVGIVMARRPAAVNELSRKPR